MGHLGIRRIIKNETFYNDSNKSVRHKCDFCVHCILKVTTLNGKCINYDVLKCKDCLSFTSIRQKGNVQGAIFKELNDEQKVLPVITANTGRKNLLPAFKDLLDVKFIEN